MKTNDRLNHLSSFIKYQRKKTEFTQKDLSIKSGTGIRFIRELEQGKKTLRVDKVNQVLDLFGFELAPCRQQLDAYLIYWNYMNKAVKIFLANKVEKQGMLIKEIINAGENKITSWKFIPTKDVIKYLRKTGAVKTEIILHSEIQNIEEL